MYLHLVRGRSCCRNDTFIRTHAVKKQINTNLIKTLYFISRVPLG